MTIFIKGQKAMVCDLHIHSRFSRACSKQLNIENLEKWGRIKGLDVLGTGDFSHPQWLEELKRELIDEGSGIFKTKTGFRFVLSWEVSLIYTQDYGRKVHLVVLAPDFEAVDKINSWLDTRGRRDYDGRPIFKISCEDFVAKMKLIDEKIEVIPAHIWTSYFGVFGSASGFDSLKEAFGSQDKNISGIETGISSDISMNSKIDELKGKSILSFSDSHSFWPWRLGREATIFKEFESYDELLRQIRENDIIGTIEVAPEYGKYHFDGHRNCGFSCSPEKTKELNGLCPRCGKPLTIGVDYRVQELSENSEGFSSDKVELKLLPLHEIISLYLGKGINTKGVWNIYNELIKNFKNEFEILLNVSSDDLKKVINNDLVDLILKNRQGKIRVKPGYDGEYGEVLLDNKDIIGEKIDEEEKQSTLK
ncbi:MAG: endonuclease Q family protein [Nanoarchaeota archaeon]